MTNGNVVSFPYNLFTIILFLLLWSSWFFIPFFHPVIKFLQSKLFAFFLLVAIAILFLIKALFALEHIDSIFCIPWLIVFFLTLQSLFFIIVSRLKSAITFILLHLGSFLVIVCMCAGAGDFLRVKLKLVQNNFIAEGVDQYHRVVSFPFALQLKKIEVDFYPPELIISVTSKQQVLKRVPIATGEYFDWSDGKFNYRFKIKNYWNKAVQFEGKFYPIDHLASSPTVVLEVYQKDNNNNNNNNNKVSEEILTVGSEVGAIPAKYFTFSDQTTVMFLSKPQAKKYLSQIKYYNKKEGNVFNYQLMVNHPLNIDGWNIYQHSYDLNNNLNHSIIEAVYDPWLPGVYIGFGMLLLGSILLARKRAKFTSVVSGFVNTKSSVLVFVSKKYLTILYICGIGIYLLYLWIHLHRPPFKTVGETKLIYAFILPVIGVILDKKLKLNWISICTVLLSLFFLFLYIIHSQPLDQNLAPALQSPWFIPHVLLYIISYSLLAVATIFAIRDFIRGRAVELTTSMVYLGTTFLTIGMLCGVFWAKTTWGHYWNWDPKECWALLSWILYVLFIHYRLFFPNKIKWAYVLLVINLFFIMICWFGINYLPYHNIEGSLKLHTYGY
ncbi:MAG: cytochrome c biogenesis protein CcsA [Oligoflexia bacterium]|nr:cytochrome c biogenesis protein CcsA [Oligoflexia bacterium]